MTNVEKFRALGIWEETLKMLASKWFETPSPIQAKTIPLLLAWDKNIIWQAETGTGKTAAFGIPLAEKITQHKNDTQAIVMAPTRELAIQVADEIRSFLHNKDINVVTVYWWQSYEVQLRALKKWADIIVGTPWRLIDHLDRKRVRLDKIKYLILDEADEMLNMWFIDDIEKILTYTNPDKSVLLFSATMPKEILNVAKKYMGEYEVISVKSPQMTTTQTEQTYFSVNHRDKLDALCRIMDLEKDFFGIVFCKTKLDVDEVAAKLTLKWYSVDWLHWDVAQNQRERIVQKFKSRKTTALIATDVAARGIDVNDITHVINYSLPQNPEAYIHRVGRTGRAGKTWKAITFISPSEHGRLAFFKRATKTDISLWKIPDVEMILASKKWYIIDEVLSAVENNSFQKQLNLAKEILKKGDCDAENIIAALLELKYENKLSSTKYREISEAKPWRDSNWDRRRWGFSRPWSYNRNSWWDRKSYGSRSRSWTRWDDKNSKPRERDKNRSSRTRDRNHTWERRTTSRIRHD